MKLSPLNLFIIWALLLALGAGAFITAGKNETRDKACNGVKLPVPKIGEFIDIVMERRGNADNTAPIYKIAVYGHRRIEYFGHEKVHRPILFEARPSMTKNITPEEMDELLDAINAAQFMALSDDTVDPKTCRANRDCSSHAEPSSITLSTQERQHSVRIHCGFDARVNDLQAVIDKIAHYHGMEVAAPDLCRAGDTPECVTTLTRMAERGYKPAQTQLGHMYAKGRGVAEDNIEAYKWLKLGNREEPFLKWLTPKMSAEELYEAKKRVTDWREKP